MPRVDPYDVYRPQGTTNVKSRFLPNDYFYIDYTPFWWRTAMDQAINYSDLSMVDALYGWCVQSSAFLRSQIDKRLDPMMVRQFRFVDPITRIENEEFTREITSTKWFKQLRRARLLSQFYGIKVVGIDRATGSVIDYPMRNIDIVNHGIRYETYNITEIAYIDDYDNIFYMQPETDQDFMLGLLQPISRAMIGYIDAYNNWAVTGKSYSYPKMSVVYNSASAGMEDKAREVGANLDDPTSTAILPGRFNIDDKELHAEIDLKPIQSQMYPNAHEVFRQLIDSWKQEVMQLVTGGTLLGATEKNTNSEQLARIHVRLYQNILAKDVSEYVDWANSIEVRTKLSNLFNDRRFMDYDLEEIPDRSIDIYDAEKQVKAMSQVGVQPTVEYWKKLGLEEQDINMDVVNGNWQPKKESTNRLTATIKDLLAKARLNNAKAKIEESNGNTKGLTERDTSTDS